jgi:hypothetical protein
MTIPQGKKEFDSSITTRIFFNTSLHLLEFRMYSKSIIFIISRDSKFKQNYFYNKKEIHLKT